MNDFDSTIKQRNQDIITIMWLFKCSYATAAQFYRAISNYRLVVQRQLQLPLKETDQGSNPYGPTNQKRRFMNKFKSLAVALILGVASLSASAIDVKHKLSVSEANSPVVEMTATYTGMTKAEYAQLVAAETKLFSATEQVGKGKSGNYSVVFSGTIIGDDGKENVLAPVILDKLTLQDVNKVMRANQKYMGDLINGSETNAAKGKKPWGNK